MKKHVPFFAILVLSALLFLLSSCTPVVPESTAITPTASNVPTRTSVPTVTLTPTTTPYQKPNLLAELGKGILPDILRSPDEKLVFVSDGYAVNVLDASNYSKIKSIKISEDRYGGIYAVSPDSKLIVVSSGFFGFQVINLDTERELARGFGGNGSAVGPVFTPDSKYIVYLMTDRTTGGPYYGICLIDIYGDKGQTDSEYGNCYPVLNDRRYHTLTVPALSPDGKLVAGGYSDSTNNILYIWDTQTKQIRFEIKQQPSSVNSVDFSPDGSLLATASDDGMVRLWDPIKGKNKRTITGFIDSVSNATFTSNGRQLLISVADQPDILYDLASGKTSPVPAQVQVLDPLAEKMLQEGYMLAGGGSKVVFSPDGNSIAVGHGSIQIWDVKTHQLIKSFSTDKAIAITGMAYSPDGSHLAVITDQGNVFSWNAQTGEQELYISAEALATGQVFYAYGGDELGPGIGAGAMSEQGIAYSPDGKQLILGNGVVIEVWDISSASKILTLEQTQPVAFPTSVSYSPDGKHIYAVLDRNRNAAIWDATTGKLIKQSNLPKVDPNAFTAIALNGSLFARNNYDENTQWIEIWDIEKEQMTKLPTFVREVEPLRFSPDGKFFIALIDHRQLYIWRTDNGQLVFISDQIYDVGDIAINAKGNILATANYGKVSLWDIGQYTEAALSENFIPPPLPPTETPWSSSNNDYPTSTPQPTQAVTPLAQPLLADDAITIQNASQIHQKAQFGNGTTSRISWIGDSIFISGSQGVYKYNAKSLKETQRFEIEGLWVTNDQLLPDGRLLIAGTTYDGRVQVWDVKSNEKLVDVLGVGEPAISPDGKWLVYANETQGLETLNLETNQDGKLLNSTWYSLNWPVFSADGKFVAAIQSNRSIRVWDLATGVIVDGVGGPEADITDMSFSPDGNYIVGAAGGSAWVWNLAPSLTPQKFVFFEGVINGNLTLFEKNVTAVAMNSDSSLIAIGTSEHDIWIYDIRTAHAITKLTGKNSVPVKLAFSPDSSQIISVDRDGKMTLWDLVTQKPLIVSLSRNGPIKGLVVRQDGSIAVWAENSVWVLDIQDASLRQTTYIPTGEIFAVSPAGDLVASYIPLRISLFDAKTGELTQTLPEEAEDVFVDYQFEGQILRQFYGATFTQDGKKLATFGAGGVWMYELPKGNLISHLEGTYTRKAAFSPDGAWLVASSWEHVSSPDLINFSNGESILGFEFSNFRYLDGRMISQYAFSPDKTWVGIVANPWNDPSTLEIINTSTGNAEKSFSFEKDKLVSLAFSSDSKLVAVGQNNGHIVLINLTDMKIITILEGHKSAVTSLAFSQDGRSIVSIGLDGILKIWAIP